MPVYLASDVCRVRGLLQQLHLRVPSLLILPLQRAGVLSLELLALSRLSGLHCKRYAISIQDSSRLTEHTSSPVFGGLLTHHFGWHTTFCFLAALAAVMAIPVFLFSLRRHATSSTMDQYLHHGGTGA